MSQTFHFGFTGTRDMPTKAQQEALETFLTEIYKDVLESGFSKAILHHGDCVGADDLAHKIATRLGMETHVYPYINLRYRAYNMGDYNEDPVRNPHQRNARIVAAATILVAVPNTYTHPGYGGTWWTIKDAERAGKDVFIVYPDGVVKVSSEPHESPIK